MKTDTLKIGSVRADADHPDDRPTARPPGGFWTASARYGNIVEPDEREMLRLTLRPAPATAREFVKEGG